MVDTAAAGIDVVRDVVYDVTVRLIMIGPTDMTDTTSSQSEHTRRAYRRAAAAFAAWCSTQGIPAMPATPEAISEYLEHRAAEGWRPATLRATRAAIADSHRRGGYTGVADHPHVRDTLARLVQADARDQDHARPLTAEAMDAIRASACRPRWSTGRASRPESVETARQRGMVDIALVSVMRDGMLSRAEASGLRWRDVETGDDGTGRLHISGSGDEGRDMMVPIGETALADLNSIRPDDADPDAPVFQLSPGHISKRVRAAALHAGIGDGYTGHSGRAGRARDMAVEGRARADMMAAGRWRTPAALLRYTGVPAAGSSTRER